MAPHWPALALLRVFETEELFAAVETLARARPLRGERLAILTNGGGPGVMAADALAVGGGPLAELAPATHARLAAVLPVNWSGGDPVDIIGDASPERSAAALDILLDDSGCDALLVMHAPTAVADAQGVARIVIGKARDTTRTILTSWLGRTAAEPCRALFAAHDIPTYETPDAAVRGFLHLVTYARNQRALRETPPALVAGPPPATEAARGIVRAALAEGRSVLSEPEAKSVLAAYGIPVVETRIAATAAAAVEEAAALGSRSRSKSSPPTSPTSRTSAAWRSTSVARPRCSAPRRTWRDAWPAWLPARG